MIRTGLMKILMWAIIPIALTLVFFATVDYERSGMWISLFFIWFAYLTVSVTCISNWGKQLSVLNWTLYLWTIGYFVAELVLAVLFLYIYSDYPQWSFAVQLLLFVVFFIIAGLLIISNRQTKLQIERLNNDKNRVTQWKLNVELIMQSNPIPEIRQVLDLILISPTKSNIIVNDIEKEIDNAIKDLPNSCNLVIRKIKERNTILKSLN